MGTVSLEAHAPQATPYPALGCSSGLLGPPPKAAAGYLPQVLAAASPDINSCMILGLQHVLRRHPRVPSHLPNEASLQ